VAAPRVVELFACVTDSVGVVKLSAFGGELLGGEVSQLQHGRSSFAADWGPSGSRPARVLQ
jgi:hypothetical protein